MRRWAGKGVLVAGAALIAAVGASTAVAVGSVRSTLGVPSVSVPSVSLPSTTVPSATVPVTVPSVTSATLTTPQVSTPAVSTPAVGVTTPTVTLPTLPVAPIKTPLGGPPPAGSNSASGSSGASGSRPAQSHGTASEATVAPGATASSGTTAASQAARRSTPRAGSAGRSAASGPRGGARGGAAGTRTTPAPGVLAATGGPASAVGGKASTGSGSRRPIHPAGRSRSSGPFPHLVKELPTAALFALLAFAVIAAAMALNAYLQRRRAKSLAGQREALLSDVGVLQAALLPAVPASLGDLEVSVAYRPAQGLAAGGDFFDVFTVQPERTGIIIGDVSGHGRESLIHAALVRYTLRTLMGEGHPLPEVLARADRYLTGELGDGFATVIICCYEHATGELIWAKAGHEPPILAGQPDPEEKAATPLGFGLGDNWPQFSRCLVPGERVCLFTDGLIEARRHGEQLGRPHLRALVDQGLSAQDLVDRIEADADECSDDLAAVIISRATAVATVPAPPAREAATV